MLKIIGKDFVAKEILEKELKWSSNEGKTSSVEVNKRKKHFG